MAQSNLKRDVRHRSIMMLPARYSYWALMILTSIFFMLLLFYFLYTRLLVRELEYNEDKLSQTAARFFVNAVNPKTGLEDPELVQHFTQSGTDTEVLWDLVKEFDSPLAITDSAGRPVWWINIDVPEDFRTRDPEVLERVQKKIRSMDRQNRPYRIYSASLDDRFVIHYGDPQALVKLRNIPLYLGTILAVFLVIAVWILRRQSRTERSLIWAGMARESAHQLGTPLSSLHGWLELLKLKKPAYKSLSEKVASSTAQGKDTSPVEILDGMAQDIERLSKVANRFELIGRRTKYQELEIEQVLHSIESYFRARLPKHGKRIELSVGLENLPPVRGNATLLEWAFENLIKNSLDALTGRDGKISIRASYDKDRQEVYIQFSDNGPGIARDIRRHVFETGVSTKSAGWGVGLTLARRIIEENHGGRLLLTHSSPEKGTVFLVRLPIITAAK